MKFYVGINGAINKRSQWDTKDEAIAEAKALWEEFDGCTAEVYNEGGDQVWFMNEKGEIK